jgi:hypothetical protein
MRGGRDARPERRIARLSYTARVCGSLTVPCPRAGSLCYGETMSGARGESRAADLRLLAYASETCLLSTSVFS